MSLNRFVRKIQPHPGEMSMWSNMPPVLLSSPSAQPAIFWYCRSCLEVRLTDLYTASLLAPLSDMDCEEDPALDCEAFARRHQKHSLGTLKRKKGRFCADRPLWDPFRIAYEEVTDGRETFLLKSWRTAISDPRLYTLLRGSLDITATVTLPEEPLRESLFEYFPTLAFLVPRLVKIMQRTVATFPPEELLPAYGSADDPQVSFASLTERHLRVLCRCCGEASGTGEKDRWWSFLATRQREEELTVEIRQHCHLRFH
jgi:hypothetical protein